MPLSLVLTCNAPKEQMDFSVEQFKALGATAFHEDGKIYVDCQNEEVEHAVRAVLKIVSTIQ
jgi:hypothetical protein